MRIQHPQVLQRTDRKGTYWFFRYWLDERVPNGSIKSTRKFHTIGPSHGPGALAQMDAEAIRDRVLAGLATSPPQQTTPLPKAIPQEHGSLLFGQLAEMWRKDYVENSMIRLAGPTRYKYLNRLDVHILPRWKNVPLNQMRSKDMVDWLQAECKSWYMMLDLRNIMSGIFTRAQEWEILPDSYANPMRRVKIGRRWTVWPEQILSLEDTLAVLDRVNDPQRLICETCLSTGTRISEVLGLTLKHVNPDKGTIFIQQRHCRGDIDVPKTKNSKRILTLGTLVSRYQEWIDKKGITQPEQWIFAQDEDPSKPMWDSGVRKAVKIAAREVGCDFPGFGLHSFRRANITWRQEVGASAIEASKIAGHGSVSMTNDYTHVQLRRQEELTRAIQQRLNGASL
jgi:integrase